MINFIVIIIIINLSINHQEMNFQGEKDKLKFLPKVSLICCCSTFVPLYICTVKVGVLDLLLLIISTIFTIITIIVTISITIISIIGNDRWGYLQQSPQ